MEGDVGFRLYVGNMFGGKTAKMIFDLQRAEIVGKKIQAFKISWDNRTEGSYLIANNGQLKYPAVLVPNLSTLEKKLEDDTQILAIDELQFWEDNILDFIREYENKMLVIGTGLQFNYRAEPFHLRDKKGIQYDSKNITMADLMGISTDIHQEWPLCTIRKGNGKICGKMAYYSQRRNEDGTLSKYSEDTIVLGGGEKYSPRCRMHYIKPGL